MAYQLVYLVFTDEILSKISKYPENQALDISKTPICLSNSHKD
jgi:hypothetical protein